MLPAFNIGAWLELFDCLYVPGPSVDCANMVLRIFFFGGCNLDVKRSMSLKAVRSNLIMSSSKLVQRLLQPPQFWSEQNMVV